MCHIAVTPLIYDFEVAMEDIDISQLYPMRYMRCYNLKNIGSSANVRGGLTKNRLSRYMKNL